MSQNLEGPWYGKNETRDELRERLSQVRAVYDPDLHNFIRITVVAVTKFRGHKLGEQLTRSAHLAGLDAWFTTMRSGWFKRNHILTVKGEPTKVLQWAETVMAEAYPPS